MKPGEEIIQTKDLMSFLNQSKKKKKKKKQSINNQSTIQSKHSQSLFLFLFSFFAFFSTYLLQRCCPRKPAPPVTKIRRTPNFFSQKINKTKNKRTKKKKKRIGFTLGLFFVSHDCVANRRKDVPPKKKKKRNKKKKKTSAPKQQSSSDSKQGSFIHHGFL